MMLEPPEGASLLRFLLLWCVRDRCPRLRITRAGSATAMARWVGGVEEECIPPDAEMADALALALRRQGPLWRRALRWFTARRRPPRVGRECGELMFRVGRHSVPVRYEARWAAGRVALIELNVGGGEEQAREAGEEMERTVDDADGLD
jgi:hypothetical protein